MYWRIEIKDKAGVFDSRSEVLKEQIKDLGFSGVEDVKVLDIYFLIGSLKKEEAETIASGLLTDSVIQSFELFDESEKIEPPAGYRPVQVMYKPGVMDPVEESALKGIRDLKINSVNSIRTAKKYLIKGKLSDKALLAIAEKLLYNKLIQNVLPEDQHHLLDFSDMRDYKVNLKEVDILGAPDAELLKISTRGQLYLNLKEMRHIKSYFKKLKRNPTDCELETIAQTWSEHCVHKTFRGIIDYKEKVPLKKPQERFLKKIGNRRIDNLLKTTIMRATKELNKKYCVSVFSDNSGVMKFDDKLNVCFKVETHNHPSALEPYGGANTGIGGVIRDPMGTGLGAKPILNTDVFCFGPLDYPASKIPQGVLHPRRVMRGVVSGVRDYGNRMGIPTANGAVLFDERFIGNPLVYCGTVGILPKEKSFKHSATGDLIVVVGGRTGRDGIHGATFSSGELTHESEGVSSGAVQIGNAITEKKMLDCLLKARDRGLYDAITDCGAGGLSSAVGEMGADLGAKVNLEKVPLKYHGLTYTEIWISEAQERMVLSVNKNKIDALLDVFSREDVEATVIGEFTDTKKLELFYADVKVCSLDMDFLHNGLPKIVKKAYWKKPTFTGKRAVRKKNYSDFLIKLLSHPDIASKEWIIRQYDHEVQGATIVKPLVGEKNDGPGDACVVKPRFDSYRGLAVSNGINFKYSDFDPYWMAASCVDESLRQLICVGASLEACAVLDNFCWGNPDKPDRLGGLVRAAYGCKDSSLGFGVPFISGKDSFYNEFLPKNASKKSVKHTGNSTIAIPGTLLISSIAIIKDVRSCLTMDLKAPGNLLYLVGETFEEMGGSHYFSLLNIEGGFVPKVDFKMSKNIMDKLSLASSRGVVRSMHDCSEGGLAVAAAEMSFAGGLGADIFLNEVPYSGKEKRDDFILFSQSNSRFIVEVEEANKKAFETIIKGCPFGLVGCVSAQPNLKFYGLKGNICLEKEISVLKEAWQKTLRRI